MTKNMIVNDENMQGGNSLSVSTDPMTGLLNATFAKNEISALCSSSSGVLMIIDLDNFHVVNETYGMETGDKLLIRFAEILNSSVRNTDIVGRITGNEFIAFCQSVDSEDVISQKTAYINEELLASAKEYLGKESEIPLGVSIGCVSVPEEGFHYEKLLQKAEEALKQAKKEGKHSYCFFHSKTSEPETKSDTFSDLAKLTGVLAERSPAKGAFTMPFAQFRVIFQFLTRVRNISQKNVWILLFNVIELEPIDEDTKERATDAFFAALHNSLRASDVVTQNSKSQFIIMLFDTELFNLEIILDRILAKWGEYEDNELFDVSYELDNVK